MEMMDDVVYIKGIKVFKDIAGETIVEAKDTRITLQGLEYLQENSIMQKIYKTAKGINEVI